MLQRAKIMWNDNLVIQRLSDEMEFAVTYSIPDVSFAEEMWISKVPGASGLLRPQTIPGGLIPSGRFCSEESMTVCYFYI